MRAASGPGLLVVALLLGWGPLLAAQTTAPGTPINTLCPVLTDEAVEPEHTVEWDGRTIGLCCAKCVRKFLENPSAYAANLPPTPPTAPPPVVAQGEFEGLLGRIHPMLVHFPVALLLAAALAEMLGALRGNDAAAPTARFCLGLAALGAVASALSGWQRAEDFRALPGTEANVDIHRWLAVCTASLALLLTLVGWGARQRSAKARAPGLGLFRWGLLLGAALVAATAHFGGTLVHGPRFPFGG